MSLERFRAWWESVDSHTRPTPSDNAATSRDNARFIDLFFREWEQYRDEILRQLEPSESTIRTMANDVGALALAWLDEHSPQSDDARVSIEQFIHDPFARSTLDIIGAAAGDVIGSEWLPPGERSFGLIASIDEFEARQRAQARVANDSPNAPTGPTSAELRRGARRFREEIEHSPVWAARIIDGIFVADEFEAVGVELLKVWDIARLFWQWANPVGGRPTNQDSAMPTDFDDEVAIWRTLGHWRYRGELVANELAFPLARVLAFLAEQMLAVAPEISTDEHATNERTEASQQAETPIHSRARFVVTSEPGRDEKGRVNPNWFKAYSDGEETQVGVRDSFRLNLAEAISECGWTPQRDVSAAVRDLKTFLRKTVNTPASHAVANALPKRATKGTKKIKIDPAANLLCVEPLSGE